MIGKLFLSNHFNSRRTLVLSTACFPIKGVDSVNVSDSEELTELVSSAPWYIVIIFLEKRKRKRKRREKFFFYSLRLNNLKKIV
jgi:hypothetical protein